MATTNFVDQSTIIEASWLNDVDALVYEIFDGSGALNANLDVGGNSIVSSSNGDITLAPNGTGNIILGNITIDGDQTAGAGQDNYVLTYDHAAGTIQLEATSGGVTDHGALTGLTDDDHTQYVPVNGTRSMSGNLTISTSSASLLLTATSGTPNIEMRSNTSSGGLIEFLNSATVECSIGMDGATDDLEFITNISGTDNQLTFESDGTLSVLPGTGNYEDLVTADDDIPNRKWITDLNSYNIKSGNQNISSSTTFTQDTSINGIVLPANATYKMRLLVHFLPNGASGAKGTITATSGSITGVHFFYHVGADAGGSNVWYANAGVTTPGFNITSGSLNTGSDHFLTLDGIFTTGGSGATVELQWAQNSSAASNLTFYGDDTILYLERIA